MILFFLQLCLFACKTVDRVFVKLIGLLEWIAEIKEDDHQRYS